MEKLKNIGLVFLMILCVCAGFGMIEMSLTDPDFQLASRIFGTVCGLILAAPGILLLASGIRTIVRRKKSLVDILRGKKLTSGELYDSMKGVLIPDFNEVKTDSSETGRLIRKFRRDYHDFFLAAGIQDNSKMQEDATQILMNVLTLQKKRLDKKGIQLETNTKRWDYNSSAPVESTSFFDGKYEITQVRETICAERVFKRENKILSRFRTSDIAKYRLLSAKMQGKSEIVCPNCGSASTRDNLLDGCDFCGTKFTIEDLGTRISEYTLQRDYEVEYERYKGKRHTYGYRVGFAIGIPVFVLSLIGMIKACFDMQSGIMMKITAVLLGASFCTFAAVYLGLDFFFFFIFPFIQSKSFLVYFGKKRFTAWQSAKEKDKAAEEKVRKQDPFFSIEGFYADLVNKLAGIHFSDNRETANAFSVGTAVSQITAVLPGYASVIHIDVESIHLDKYSNDGKNQIADVSAVLSLLKDEGSKARSSKERLRLRLIKSADCQTQAVCAPSLLQCSCCGGNLSMVEGLVCSHCGTKADIPKVTWAILEYRVKA